MSDELSRRDWLLRVASGAAATAVLGAGRAFAQSAEDFQVPVDDVPAPMPVAFVGHGAPSLGTDPVRGAALAAWGRALPRPTGVVALTPHYRSVGHAEIGAVGPGRALASFPRAFAAHAGPVVYASPDNTALARKVEEAVPGIARSADRRGFDHTVWMPLKHLRPAADLPVVEVALPFAPDPELFALGRALAPLRRQGVLLLCSGNVVHNLAMIGDPRPPVPWARRFDEWIAESLETHALDRIVDWRRAAPEPYLAHPDDGGHLDVLLVGLGAYAAFGATGAVRFPEVGFDPGSLSKRAIELA